MAVQEQQYDTKALRKYGYGWEDTLPKEVTYVDGMAKFDARPALREGLEKKSGIDFSKANTISGLTSGTTDLTLVPIYVDPMIVDQTRRLTPLVELIPRVTNYGRTADFNQLTARGVVGWRQEDAALSELNDTYSRSSTGIKFAYQVGRVSGPLLAASRQYLASNYMDALNLEIRNKTVTMRYTEEDTIINGDATTTRTAYGGNSSGGDAAAYANEFSGLFKSISTNSITVSGNNITINYLRQAIRQARTANNSATLGQGDPNLMVTDFATLDNIKALLQDYQRYVNTTEIAWGMKTVEFEGLPIVASKFCPTSSNVKKLAVLDTNTWQMRVLQDMTYEELAKTNDSYKFMMKLYETLITTAEMFNAQLTTLA